MQDFTLTKLVGLIQLSFFCCFEKIAVKVDIFTAAVTIATVIIFIAIKATEGKFFILFAIIEDISACNTANSSESNKCVGETLFLAEEHEEHKECAYSFCT